MTNRERFKRIINFNTDVDRLPMLEWATWWDLTLANWRAEGVPAIAGSELMEYFGLDPMEQFCIRGTDGWLSEAVTDGDAYLRVLSKLYPENAVARHAERIGELKPRHDRGEILVWVTLEGCFWFPRSLMGIERHLYAFYDYPELMHKIIGDLTRYNLSVIGKFTEIIRPDFATIAEDMSYNHGPMLSETHFKEFIAPHYKVILDALHSRGIKVFIDTDGDPGAMVGWLRDTGVDGLLPLERQAGTDVNSIRSEHPELLMLGAFDKMVMNRGEQAIESEFRRLLPLMRGGGYIPSVDHQTPPSVSLADYRQYLRLLNRYCRAAVE